MFNLTRLLRTSKSSDIPTIIENGESITDPKQKADLLNQHFSSKASVPGKNDDPPNLNKFNVLSDLNNINTSPIELGKIMRDLKKSHYSHCGVPDKFLSLISTTISFPMSTMFNDMFKNGYFPDTL